MARFARIVSTGRFVPPIEVPNAALKARWPQFPDFVDKMEASSGIRTRFYAPEEWATSDVALPAARQAIERAGLVPEDVDLIILGTDSPDYVTPATSVVLQHKLGAKNAGTFDVGCACASFPTGLAAAAGLIATNPALKNVLVVGVYLMHKLADPNDPMVFFYGDGAGAAILQAGDEPGFINAAMQAGGEYAKHWGIFAGGTAEPATVENVSRGPDHGEDGRALPARDQPRGVAPPREAPVEGRRLRPRRRRLRSSSPRCASPPSTSSWPTSGSRSRRPTRSWRSGATPARPASRWPSTTPSSWGR